MSTDEARIGTGPGAVALLRGWRVERLQFARFVPLALLLAWAGSLGVEGGVGAYAARSLIAFALLTQFRLWDDLADASRDRIAHPARLLARLDDRRVFAAVCIVLGIVNALALYRLSAAGALLGFCALNLLLALWYRLNLGRGLRHLHVLLLKYPAFVLLLGGPGAPPLPLLAAAAAIYVAVCLFDMLDDAGRRPPSKVVLALHAVSMTVLAFVPGVDAAGACIAALGVIPILAVSMRAPRAGFLRPLWKFAPFLAAVGVLVRSTLGGSP